MANGWGGARPGAGRKPNVPDAFYRATIDEIWRPKWRAFVEELARLALTSESDKIRLGALTYILDRVLGKPVQATVDESDRELIVRVVREEARSTEEVKGELRRLGLLADERSDQ